jgi:hypothetical protein
LSRTITKTRKRKRKKVSWSDACGPLSAADV